MDTEAKSIFHGQAQVWKNIYSYVDFMALKCALELGIPDILHSQNRPMSLADIASKIPNASSPNILNLSRIMRLLTYNKIFTSTTTSNRRTDAPPSITVYGATAASKWLVRDKNKLNLAPVLLLQNHPFLRKTWDQLGACVREGGYAFHKAHGCEMWDLAAQNPEFSKIAKEAKESIINITMDAMISGFSKDAWNGLESMVAVGGGNGQTIADIVKTYPHIKGINFDAPHVIATEPKCMGVSHVEGDMLDSIPCADAVFMKFIPHQWDDETCVKILRNCKKAIPGKGGKIFIVDVVLNPDCNEVFGSTRLAFDVVVMASTRGMLRTEVQWKSLLQKGGFPRYKITVLPTFYSIIQAFPNST